MDSTSMDRCDISLVWKIFTLKILSHLKISAQWAIFKMYVSMLLFHFAFEFLVIFVQFMLHNFNRVPKSVTI